MKVLVAHNRYRSAVPSGENRVVDSEIDLLRRGGLDVVPFLEDSDQLVSAGPALLANAAAGPIYAPRGIRRLRKLLDHERPDVVHLHNVFPLISPWAIRSARSRSIPVVQTVHNYRHTCVSGLHLREGKLCLDCTHSKRSWPAMRHGCYRGSRAQSALMVAGQLTHRSTWRSVDRFLTTSPSMGALIASTGVDPNRIELRPTYAEDHGAAGSGGATGVAFVGRLELAKGIRLLLEAWTPAVARRWGRLIIAGDGPDRELVSTRAAVDPSVEWRGSLDASGCRKVMRESTIVAIPSLWLEGFPRVAAEAMSLGRPLAMSSGAGFSAISADGVGWAVEPTARAWTDFLLAVDDAQVSAASGAARQYYEARCSPVASLEQLLRTYRAVIRGPVAA